MTGLTGVDDPYEPPVAPEVVVPAHEIAVDDAVDWIVKVLP
jgi:adenylylsulfate kinase-like enzyme